MSPKYFTSFMLILNLASLCLCWKILKQTSNKNEIVVSKNNSTLFTVSIQRRSVHWCTGTLISNNWVLTAGDPFYRVREIVREFTVRAATDNCEAGGMVLPVKRIYVNPYFKHGGLDFDLAMLKMARSMVTKPIKPVWIKKISTPYAVVSYWPNIIDREHHQQIYFDTKVKFPDLITVESNVLEPRVCEGRLLDHKIIDPNLFCITVSANNGAAVGAPVTNGASLIGVVSSWSYQHREPFEDPFIIANNIYETGVRLWINETLSLK